MPLVRLDGGVFAWSGGRVRFQRDFEGAEWKGRVNSATGATRRACTVRNVALRSIPTGLLLSPVRLTVPMVGVRRRRPIFVA